MKYFWAISLIFATSISSARSPLDGHWLGPVTIYHWVEGNTDRTTCSEFELDLWINSKNIRWANYQWDCHGPEVQFDELFLSRMNEKIYYENNQVGFILGDRLSIVLPILGGEREIDIWQNGERSIRYKDILRTENRTQTLNSPLSRDWPHN